MSRVSGAILTQYSVTPTNPRRKNMKHIVRFVIVSIALFALTACAPAATPTAAPTVAPTTAPATQPPAVPTIAPTTPPELTATAAPASTAIKLVDALGREVTFEKAPERIVIAGKATT